MKMYTIHNFPFKIFKRFRYVPKSKKDKKYVNVCCTFDIETTTIKEKGQSFMYIWSFSIDGEYWITGRTWEEFFYLLMKIKSYSRKKDVYVIYVHNLSFEFEFLAGIYDFQRDEVFCLEPHKILKCSMYDQFEFRCSYLLTQKKLVKFLQDEGVPEKYQKSGFFDYDKIRFHDSRLKKYELIYCRNDVVGLALAVKKYISDRGYDLRTTPLTATGFLRVDHRQKMREVLHQSYFTQRHDDKEILQYLHLAFRGGNTHANARYIGEILTEVFSYDIKSSYPAALYNGRYPLEKFKPVHHKLQLNKLNNDHAYLMYIELHDVKLKDIFEPIPYIPLSKCVSISKDYILDNGRIRETSKLSMWLTEIDMQIINDQYEYDTEKSLIIKAYGAKKERLPGVYREYVYNTFKQKETLEKDTLEYRIFKAFLNAIYGNCVMYPLKYNTIFEDGSFFTKRGMTMKSTSKRVLIYIKLVCGVPP